LKAFKKKLKLAEAAKAEAIEAAKAVLAEAEADESFIAEALTQCEAMRAKVKAATLKPKVVDHSAVLMGGDVPLFSQMRDAAGNIGVSVKVIFDPAVKKRADERKRELEKEADAIERQRRLDEREQLESGGIEQLVGAIKTVRAMPQVKQHVIFEQVARLVRKALSDPAVGFFVRSQYGLWFFDQARKALLGLETEEFGYYLTRVTGLIQNMEPYPAVLQDLMNLAASTPTKPIHNLGHVDADGTAYYYAGSGIVFVHHPGEPVDQWRETSNGKPHLFYADEIHEYVEPNYSAKGAALARLNNLAAVDGDRILTVDDCHTLMSTFIVTEILGDASDHRILLTLGDTQSGKTSPLRNIGRVVLGPKFLETLPPPSVRDLNVMISNRSVRVVDNFDEVLVGVETTFCGFGTGTASEERKMRSNGETFMFDLRTMLMISSRDPRFLQEDVCTRIIPIWFKQIDGLPITETAMAAEVNTLRSKILGDLLRLMGRYSNHVASGLKVTTTRVGLRGNFETMGQILWADENGAAEPWRATCARLKTAQLDLAFRGTSYGDILAKYLEGGKIPTGTSTYAVDISLDSEVKEGEIPLPIPFSTFTDHFFAVAKSMHMFVPQTYDRFRPLFRQSMPAISAALGLLIEIREGKAPMTTC
jgi:hypothetical protein